VVSSPESLPLSQKGVFPFLSRIQVRLVREIDCRFKWINWQAVSTILLDVLEQDQEQAPNYLYAVDLYQLLDKKKLRGFLPFTRLMHIYNAELPPNIIFFSAQTSAFRGDFIGFETILSVLPRIDNVPKSIFYSVSNFTDLPIVDVDQVDHIFFWGTQHES